MIKKITLQFTLYRSVIFSNTVITITFRKSKTMRDKISSRCFFPVPSSLQTRISPDLQKEKATPSKFECPFNLSLQATGHFPSTLVTCINCKITMPQNCKKYFKKIHHVITLKQMHLFWFFLSYMHACNNYIFTWMQLLREFVFPLMFT